MSSIRQWLQRNWAQLREYSGLADIGEIARRYFAINAFDGVLTILGVLMGNYAAQVRDPAIIVTTGLSTCMAIGISGLWGSYLSEAAERRRDLRELQNSVLVDLSGTKIGRASRVAAVIVALVDGLAPVVSGLVVLSPFLLVGLLPSVMMSYYLGIGLALVVLFALGLFLGVSAQERNWFWSGAKMVVAGVVSILLSYFLRASQ